MNIYDPLFNNILTKFWLGEIIAIRLASEISMKRSEQNMEEFD